MKKTYLTAIFLLTIFCLTPAKVFADTICQPIYGGGQTCVTTGNISVNKKVLNPQTNEFVDWLNINDPRYHPENTVTFKITVTNTDDAKVSKIKVTDIFPQHITFSSGPGSFDSNTKTLTFETYDLEANESRDFTVVGKIVNSSEIPTNEGDIVCVVNQAHSVNLDNSSQTSHDNAQLCIQKGEVKGFPTYSTETITVTPSTGPGMLGFISLIPTGIAGWFLRKKSFSKN